MHYQQTKMFKNISWYCGVYWIIVIRLTVSRINIRIKTFHSASDKMAALDARYILPGYNDSNATPHDIIILNDVIGYRIIQRLLLAVYVVVALLGIVGNGIVMHHLIEFRRRTKYRRRSTATHMLVFNLTLCDLFNSLVCQPLRMADILQLEGGYIHISATYCRCTVFLGALFTITGFHILTAISLERYFLVCWPMKVKSIMTTRRMICVTAFIWILSLVCGALWSFPFVDRQHVFVNGHHMAFCFWRMQTTKPLSWVTYYHVIVVLYFFLPVSMMIFCYTRVFRTLYKNPIVSPNEDYKNSIARNNDNRQAKSRRALAKVMLLIAIVFTVLHTPFFMILLLFTNGIRPSSHYVFMIIIAKFLFLVNSTLNPFLYCVYSRVCFGGKMLHALTSVEERMSKTLSSGSKRLFKGVSATSLRGSRLEMNSKGDVQCVATESDHESHSLKSHER